MAAMLRLLVFTSTTHTCPLSRALGAPDLSTLPQPTQLIIVRRGRHSTFRLLEREFRNDPTVRIIWDRRYRDRTGHQSDGRGRTSSRRPPRTGADGVAGDELLGGERSGRKIVTRTLKSPRYECQVALTVARTL